MSAIVFKGEYNDGVSASAHAVDVAFADGSFIIQDERFPKSAPVYALRISARLGRLPRTLTLPDGSQVVLPDSVMLSQQLQEGSSYLGNLEANAVAAVVGVVLLIACAWGFYVVLLPWLSDTVARAISIETEEKLSDGSLKDMDAGKVWKASALTDAQQRATREQLEARLGSAALKPAQLLFRESAVFGANAFALPGSKIVITDKLVEVLSPGEIAAVVAHELGHLHHKHNARMMVREVGLSGVLNLLMGFRGANDSIVGAAQALGQAKYSREFEAEADAYSTQLMKAVHMSPCLLASALLKLEKATPVEPGSHATWFASHPPTQARINDVGGACPSPIALE
jgi:Zn-dependent protease with chaperone function